ncbi:hypothetical protein PHYPSEUDO_003193 [Phytophthora pseudosyringae]|uniref:Uncharacterized protein n=1 Tax=Phytophthora pseudosyringae TaxID=221518 RepID=A0A8T1VS06_9STRA|nr:hypothetical protein PHYPSEUDO_003193 [Phytophthora pseudosyringae]
MRPSLASHLLLAAILAAASLADENLGKTSTGDVIQNMSEWGAPVVASTGTNITSSKPTFGKITSKAGECVVGSPTEYISEEYLDWIWQNRIGPNADTTDKNKNWNIMASKNFLMDNVHYTVPL